MEHNDSTLSDAKKFDLLFRDFIENGFERLKESIEKNFAKALEKDKINTWLSKEEARIQLKVSPKTFNKYLQDKLIPYSQVVQKIYIKAIDLEEFLNKHSASE